MKTRRSWWLAYGACAAVVVGALLWVTVTVLGLERAEIEARRQAQHQESLRLALWRMDSWLAPELAQEAARPYFDYQPFYPQARAYTAVLEPIRPGEVLTPSPLLSFESPYFPLHFQIDPDGRLTSPQAPEGDYRRLAEGAYLSDDLIVSNSARLDAVGRRVTPERVAECVADAETQPTPAVPLRPEPSPTSAADEAVAQALKTRQELGRRQGNYQRAIEQQRAAVAGPRDVSVVVGSFVPFWSRGAGRTPELVFTRSVLIGDRQYYQGFICDWPALRAALLEQVTDLFAAADLVPMAAEPGYERGTLLATIPAALEVTSPAPVAAAMVTPARSTLALAWFAVLAGLVAVAVTLRASIDFGRRRARFASAVTHELRTPLTTFRMYSQMLADGIVSDPRQRQDYLETLKGESGRLSNLVENVLAYARLEEGRRPARPTPTTWGRLWDEVLPPLRQRADAADMRLEVNAGAADDEPLTADADAVGQILFNLVDNACKYAADAADRTIELTGRIHDGQATLSVRDHGPGVSPAVAGTIFDPFDRGARHDGDGSPGVGLGLALARGLAHELGGELRIDPAVRDGACFTLALPVR